MDVNALVSKVQQGDTEAFGQLYDNFAQRIFKFIRLKIQDRQEAEDLLQEVFLKAYRGMGALKLENLNFSAWLYRVTSNTINDYFRKKYRRPDPVPINENFDMAQTGSLEAALSVKTDMEIMRKVFVHLPPLYKQVLELRFLQEFSVSETAQILNKNNLSVRLIQYRALKKVRIILAHSYGQHAEKIS